MPEPCHPPDTHRHAPTTEQLADARTADWLAEMWPTVHQYRPGFDEPRSAAKTRRQGLATFWGDEPAEHYLRAV